jgi:hypothetical protein
MFKWFWNWLDGLDGNVDGAVFGLGKAVQKLDKAIAANERQAQAATVQSSKLVARANAEARIAQHKHNEAERASRIKSNVEALLK